MTLSTSKAAKHCIALSKCVVLNEDYTYSVDPNNIRPVDTNSASEETNKANVSEDDFITAVLKGDADLNGNVDIADLTTVAKYNLSNEAYPLKNKVAEANADMNGDGKVEGLDTSALIENQLGKKDIE